MTSDRWASDAESVLYADVTRLLVRYARGVDRRDWDLVRSTFHDDASDDHGAVSGSPEEFIGFMQVAQEYMTVSTHPISNIELVEIDRPARRVLVESYCVGRQVFDGPPSKMPALFDTDPLVGYTGPRMCTVGNRYVDVVSDKADLRIASRLVVFDWVDVRPYVTSRDFDARTHGRRDRTDTSYQETWTR
jgi:hypothetical protein